MYLPVVVRTALTRGAACSLPFALALAAGCPSPDGDPEPEPTVTATPILEILEGVELGTAWADLDEAKKAELEVSADLTLAAYAQKWNQAGLEEKERVLTEEPTAAMTANFDLFVQERFGANPDFTASTDVTSPALLAALQKAYIANVSAAQYMMWWLAPGASETTWDGETTQYQFPLPEGDTRKDHEAYGRSLVADLTAIDATALPEAEAQLHEKALFVAHQLAAGSLGFAYGGADLETPWGRAIWAGDVVYLGSAEVGNAIYENDEAYLSQLNAMLMPEHIYVNVGTVALMEEFLAPIVFDPGFIAFAYGDPAESDAARAITLLTTWYVERLAASADAEKACTIYSQTQRNQMYEAFAGDSLFDKNLENNFGVLEQNLNQASDIFTGNFKTALLDSVRALYTVDELSEAEFTTLQDRFDAELNFGNLTSLAPTAIADITGEQALADRITAAFDNIGTVGGYGDDVEAVPAEDDALLQTMWTEVRTYLIDTYDSDLLHLEQSLPTTVTTTLGTSIYTQAGEPSYIEFGLGTPYNLAYVYAILIHEAHHAASFGASFTIEGLGWEGAASLTERMVTPDFFATFVPEQDRGFWVASLSVGDARRFGITGATLGLINRESCDDGKGNMLEFAADVAAGYGLSGPGLDEAQIRAQWGTQILGYLVGQTDYLARIEDMTPAAGFAIDPWMLLQCGMPNPRGTAAEGEQIAGCFAVE